MSVLTKELIEQSKNEGRQLTLNKDQIKRELENISYKFGDFMSHDNVEYWKPMWHLDPQFKKNPEDFLLENCKILYDNCPELRKVILNWIKFDHAYKTILKELKEI